VINDSITEEVTDFKYLEYSVSEYESDLEDKFQTYNKINGALRRHFGKQMDKETKLRIHNITAKAALKFGSEAWALKTGEEKRLEAAQMKFFRHLIGITKLDIEKNQRIKKTGAQNTVREIKHYQEKWVQHVQRMDTNRIPKQALQYQPKERRNIGRPRRDGGINFTLRIKEQETRLTFQEYDDDYDIMSFILDNVRAGKL